MYSGSEDMTNLLGLRMILSWWVLVINNPFMMSLLFCQILVLTSCLIGGLSPFMGLMVFLVYVGGILILIRYCVILIPSSKFAGNLSPFLLLATSYPFLCAGNPRAFTYGLLYRRRAVLLLGILLYFVLLAVVEIINYSRGTLKR